MQFLHLFFAFSNTNIVIIIIIGKTYTIQGSEEAPGILPRIFSWLFSKLQQYHQESMNNNNNNSKNNKKQQQQQQQQQPNGQLEVCCSYLEIYNEKIYDLLDDSPIDLHSNNNNNNNNENSNRNNVININSNSNNNNGNNGNSNNTDKFQRPDLKLQSDSNGHVFVTGLREVEIQCADEAKAILKQVKKFLNEKK